MSRPAFRAMARAALAADVRMSALTMISAWAGNISASELPVIGVVTPQERSQAQTLEDFEKSTLLQIVVKRLGAEDLEDVLDADADAIEACIVTAFLQAGFRCLPEDTTFTLNGEGEQKIGTVLVSFRVTWFRSL
ncbi:MAG: hypothetical protein ACK4NH_04470 [Gemmobacter sp.]